MSQYINAMSYDDGLGSLLQTQINFNPSMDK